MPIELMLGSMWRSQGLGPSLAWLWLTMICFTPKNRKCIQLVNMQLVFAWGQGLVHMQVEVLYIYMKPLVEWENT
jgi:hypothetical protein